MKITFHGATETVTGSKHLITLWDNEQVLLDCGMYQGLGKETLELNREWGFDPSQVDHLVLSHAHIDHSGLIPKLVKDGFKGKIYCTPATYDLCQIMLMDSAHIQEADVLFINKRRKAQERELIEPLYRKTDVEKCLEQFVTVPYDTPFQIRDHIKLLFTNNGHILGSATVHLTLNEITETNRLTYTGDIGRYDTALLKDPTAFQQPDYLICESTYGDRLHGREVEADQELLDVIIETCQRRKGKVIIPAFSLGRTQEIVYALNKLNLHGLLPNVNVYVDSPLAVSATNIMRKYRNSLNLSVQNFLDSNPDPFGFEKLTYITDKRDSQALNADDKPAVIISASGMADAGRIKHHLMHNIQNPLNTVLIVGYASPRSLSGKLRNGDREVTIFGMPFEVKADVHVIDSLSAHGDYEEMLKYLSCVDATKIRQTFLVHGEPDAQEAFKGHLHNAGFRNIRIPSKGLSIDLG